MREAARVGELLKDAVEGNPYYGPSALAALGEVRADRAAFHPAGSAHSIWEIGTVQHVTYHAGQLALLARRR